MTSSTRGNLEDSFQIGVALFTINIINSYVANVITRALLFQKRYVVG